MSHTPVEQPDIADDTDGVNGEKLVPVTESIKYRRRAQQAEGRLQQIEQQLNDLQAQFEHRSEELATAESQRDEAHAQLTHVENRLAAERLLSEAGVVDLDAAATLLSQRADLTQEIDRETLAHHVEELLLNKPFLRSPNAASLPGTTASPRATQPSAQSLLAQAGEQAMKTGNRRDVAEYLRLRRQTVSR